ncbi:MAG: sigma-70 family RNA polymerase sigma factor [Anaerolinea sp.]|nr:sigma-70 family RNA polymerase sigma factor [Anaerolinea sp.]
MVSMTDDEQILIRNAQRGDLDSFNSLVLIYQNAAFTLAYRIMGETSSASDAAQEAMITAYRRLSTYRGGSFRAWLMRIVTNRCYDELRRIKRRPQTTFTDLTPEDADEPAIADDAATPEEVTEARELQRAVQRCINRLNADQKLVLVLCDIEGMDYAEISEQVGTTLGTVKSRLSRARASVRDCLSAVRELLPSAYRLISNQSEK